MTELCPDCERPKAEDWQSQPAEPFCFGGEEWDHACWVRTIALLRQKLAASETKLADAVRRELAEAEQYQQARVEELKAREKLAASERENEQATIRVREGRGLLQRMVKYVREDRATTERATRLARLTDQVADYLQRTHDPRWLLRDKVDG